MSPRHSVAGGELGYHSSVPRPTSSSMSSKTGRQPPLRFAAATPALAPASDARGVTSDESHLTPSRNVERKVIPAAREVHVKRLDPFEALHRRGGLSAVQHHAAVRLFRDWCQSVGVRTDDPRVLLDLHRSAAYGPSDLVNCRMIDASTRFEAALAAVGPATAEVLRALVTPAVMCGSVSVWRSVIERVTGETHTHAQASVVRRACEDLRLAYERRDRAFREKATPA